MTSENIKMFESVRPKNLLEIEEFVMEEDLENYRNEYQKNKKF